MEIREATTEDFQAIVRLVSPREELFSLKHGKIHRESALLLCI